MPRFSVVRARAPLRLGLAGGGSDISPFCDRYGGRVVNVAINRYAWASIIPRSDDLIVLEAADLDQTEALDARAEIDATAGLRLHRGAVGRVRRELGLTGGGGFTLTTSVDSPVGAGLGSSSALMVAILAALYAAAGRTPPRAALAHAAVEVERGDLALNGGRQDQYAAAFGGCSFLEFGPGPRARVERLHVPPSVWRELETSLVLLHTGVSRQSARIIDAQAAAIDLGGEALEAMHQLRAEATAMRQAIRSGDLNRVARVLRSGWAAKKRTSSAVSTAEIEELYEAAMRAGAVAGKASGAGGGGFMMFLVEPMRRPALIRSLGARAGITASTAQFVSRGVEVWRPRSPLSVGPETQVRSMSGT